MVLNEQEKADLHKTIWKIANDLRGSVDGWDFKQYVLGMLFYRFISEKLINDVNTHQHKSGEEDFDFTTLGDEDAELARKEFVQDDGFYILPSELFSNIRKKAKNNDDLNETLETIFKNIENSAKGTNSEESLKGLFDDFDFNSNKLGSNIEKRNKLLIKLLDSIGDLNLGNFKDHSIDTFGDTYEFLLKMYASSAGKSGGEFFTPQEVSELLAKITTVGKKKINKVYDPACGSGSLLLKFNKILGEGKVSGFYGQEINISTFNLCRMNMYLHNINYENFDITHGDTLINPKQQGFEPFDAIVSNPPYSINWEGDDNPLLINDERFKPAGVLAPKSKADLAFVMHILHSLANDGTAAIVEFPGVLYRGGAEGKIRKYLIDNNFVDCVIQLPSNLFFGTSIATCIIVLKKDKQDDNVLFIDASDEFEVDGNKNKLNSEHQDKILNKFIERIDTNETEYISKLVSKKDISSNDYNIAVSSYVEKEDLREKVNIKKLNLEISDCVKVQNELKKSIDKIVKELEGEK